MASRNRDVNYPRDVQSALSDIFCNSCCALSKSSYSLSHTRKCILTALLTRYAMMTLSASETVIILLLHAARVSLCSFCVPKRSAKLAQGSKLSKPN